MTTSFPTPAPPNSWWTIADAAMEIEPAGPCLYYRLDERAPIRDDHGRWVRDAAGRVALEAFGALPLADLYGRLARAGESIQPTTRSTGFDQPPVTARRRWLDLWPEVREFVTTFGPLGFEWSRTFPVTNPEADRVMRRRSRGGWQVVFPAPGFATARVGRTYPSPKGSWADRVQAGDTSLPRDFLGLGEGGALWGHQDDLRAALGLVRALAEEEPNPQLIRSAAGRLPRVGGYDLIDRGPRDPVDRRWSDALRSRHRIGARDWSPFTAHPTSFDSRVVGRIMLADFLSTQLGWIRMDVGLDERGRFRSRWTPRTLLEIIYLQLLEHVEQRLHFGVGECPHCRGPILRTRASERTRNRAHHGCANVLRKRRQRERQRGVPAPEAPG